MYYAEEKTSKKAFSWFYNAAHQNYCMAQYQLGYMYHIGQGVHQTYQESMHWYLKAADNGHTEVVNRIGCFYKDGLGCKKIL
jgi:TPR repeat protein